MKANPGGQIAVEDVVGRERLIETIWDTLEQQSVILVAERRIGKTTVMQVMEAQPRKNWKVVRQDVEKCGSAMEFAKLIFKDVGQFLSIKSKAMRKCHQLLKISGDVKIGSFQIPKSAQVSWKELIESAIEDLVEACKDGDKLVFMWDEIPYMIENIRKNEGAQVAMSVLDVLRAMRQNNGATIRMVYTGSIGLHHVLEQLKNDGYGNKATKNDMCPITVPVLTEEDALKLAEALLRGENIKTSDHTNVANEIITQADYFAHYIHGIVKALKMLHRDIELSDVSMVVGEKLSGGGQDWDLDHYEERLQDYYLKDEGLCLAILECMANSEDSLSRDELVNGVSKLGSFGGKKKLSERLRKVLKKMVTDHYFTKSEDGKFTFLFGIVKRWCRINFK